MPITFTTKGYIRLYCGDRFVSQHRVAEEAYESALADAEANGGAVYRVEYPNRELDLSSLSKVVLPSAPVIAAVQTGQSSVSVTWPAIFNATSYRVRRNGVIIASPTTNSFSDTGLAINTAYTYTVASVNGSGEGPQSNQSSVTIGDATAPSIPANLTATATSSSAISVAWNAATDNVAVTGYRLQRATDEAFTANVVTLDLGTGTSYSATGLSASTQYYFRIQARDAAGNFSGYSATANATTQAAGGGAGNTITAASPSQTDVAAAIAAASVGDTVQVPAGSGTWNTLSINKAVRIVGAGIGQTNITLGTGNSITKQAAGVTRLRGFTMNRSGGGNATVGFTLTGAWAARPIIFEECRFNVTGSGLFHPFFSGGVIWAKCEFHGGWDDSFIAPKNFGAENGQAEWRTASTFGMDDPGGERNFYVEDCYLRGGTNQGTDWDYNSRIVYRYNRNDYTSFNSHGLATGPVGMRHFEIYGNKFWNTSCGGWLGFTDFTQDISAQNWAIWIRGGTGVIYNNEIDNIANSYWGFTKAEGKFDIRAQQDNSGAAYGTNPPPVAWTSAGQGNYPRQHQLAVSWDGRAENSGYFIDPIYIWGNTGAGTNTQGGLLGFANGGSWGSQAGYFNEGRDFFNGGSAKPGYTPYTYPHPLRESTGQAY